MEIYTTYFDRVGNLSKDIIPISIALKPPKCWRGKEYKKLAPKESFFYEWKKSLDNEYYINHFKKEVLSILNADDVVRELFELIQGEKIALVCYEQPEEFCHRHLVADWLGQHGYEVREYVFDDKADSN